MRLGGVAIYVLVALFLIAATLTVISTAGPQSSYTIQTAPVHRTTLSRNPKPSASSFSAEEEEEEEECQCPPTTVKEDPDSNARLIRSLRQKFRESVKHIFEGVDSVVLMDHPEYKNRGDSALYVGEVEFIRSLGIPIIYECSQAGRWTCNTDEVRRVLSSKTGLVCFSGGGNFGDLWPWLREAKESWLAALPDYRVFQFPQTVHFKNMHTAWQSAQKWAAHPNVTITVRDEASVAFLKEYFPTNEVLLVPDAAFLMSPKKRFAPAVDMLWLMREDKESAQSFSNYTKLTSYVRSLVPRDDISIVVRDWLAEDAEGLAEHGEQVLARRATTRTIDGIRILSEGKIVVSDRLHAHILSTVADIPHVILDNENGKVLHVHGAWTNTAKHIKLATSLDDAMDKAVQLLDEYNAREGYDKAVESKFSEVVGASTTVPEGEWD